MPGNRKLAAVMFTDVVGYSAMMSKNEKWALDILERVASTSGFSVRLGIHIGEIVVVGNDVFGDSVNVASRIEAAGESDRLYVSGRVYEDIRNKSGIGSVFVREMNLKNIDHPVRVYAVFRKEEGYPIQAPGEEINSIVVLPFVDLSPGKDQEHFCDGLSEEIINTLTQIEGLKVIARTSAFAFKNQFLDVREIGRKLGVNTLLEGSVRKSGKRIRITAQLINISDGSHLWSERYDREIDDLFAIQDETSLKIAENLKISLNREERSKLTWH